MKEEISEEVSSLKKDSGEHFSENLLSIFREKHPYYLIGETIAFPIEDSLFELYTELKNTLDGSLNLLNEKAEELPQEFCN